MTVIQNIPNLIHLLNVIAEVKMGQSMAQLVDSS